MICDGVLAGVFGVLSFIPQIMLLFLFLTILEDSGYMARVAFIMDRAFRRIGLSGKSFMPLLMCFGCAVPGIMATRTIENDRERRSRLYCLHHSSLVEQKARFGMRLRQFWLLR